MYLNLPIRCPSSGTKNTTLETHTCKSPLSYLGCKNCRRRLFRVFSVFSGVFSLLRRESGSALTNQDTVCWDRCFWLACLFVRNNECTKNLVYFDSKELSTNQNEGYNNIRDFSSLISSLEGKVTPKERRGSARGSKSGTRLQRLHMDRLFTVLYFSVRSSRSSTLRYGLPSCMSVKTT